MKKKQLKTGEAHAEKEVTERYTKLSMSEQLVEVLLLPKNKCSKCKDAAMYIDRLEKELLEANNMIVNQTKVKS